MESDTPTMKFCHLCERTLPITEFYRNSHHRDGYLNRCKPCHIADCSARHKYRAATEPAFRKRHSNYSTIKRQDPAYRDAANAKVRVRWANDPEFRARKAEYDRKSLEKPAYREWKRAYNREWKRNKYQTDPAYRQKVIDQTAAYRERKRKEKDT